MSKAGTPHGFTKFVLREGLVVPKAQVSASARGLNAPMPGLFLSPPVRVQLLIDDGPTTGCWEAVYTSFQKNDAGQFKAKGP